MALSPSFEELLREDVFLGAYQAQSEQLGNALELDTWFNVGNARLAHDMWSNKCIHDDINSSLPIMKLRWWEYLGYLCFATSATNVIQYQPRYSEPLKKNQALVMEHANTSSALNFCIPYFLEITSIVNDVSADRLTANITVEDYERAVRTMKQRPSTARAFWKFFPSLNPQSGDR